MLQEGGLTVRHFNLYSQALAKIERGFTQDLEDVASMLEHGLVQRTRAIELFEEIEPLLFRYPAIDPGSFRAKIEHALG